MDDKSIAICCQVNPTESYFQVDLPNYFFIDSLKNDAKQISLTDVMMYPNYFSEKAVKHGLDFGTEIEAYKNITVSFSAELNKLILRKSMNDADKYLVNHAVALSVSASEIMEGMNRYFEKIKPAEMQRVPGFFDWTHTEIIEEDLGDEEYMTGVASLLYEDGNLETKKDALHPSVLDLVGVNKYDFPTLRNAALMRNIRARLNIAPNTRIVFSNKYLLSRFGIPSIYYYTKNNQIVVENATDRWQRLEAVRCFFFVKEDDQTGAHAEQTEIFNFIEGALTSGHYKVFADIVDPQIRTRDVIIPIRQREWNSSDRAVELCLIKVIRTITNMTNIKLSMTYTSASRRFYFVIPSDASLVQEATLHIEPELAIRIGYGPIDSLTWRSRPLEAVTEELDSEAKARTLVYNTRVVLITLDQTVSHSTLNANQHVLALLYPVVDGTMRSTDWKGKHTVTLPSYSLGSDNIAFKCNLWTFNLLGEKVPLKWNTSATITGIIRSRKSIK